MADAVQCFQSTDALFAHWQGHRRLTHRLIEAYPEDELFRFHIGTMRTFGAIVEELLSMAAPMLAGLATGRYDAAPAPTPQARSRAALLARWDEATDAMTRTWPSIPPERFQETVTAFGQYTAPAFELVLYVIDNEIHHRGQAYAYARALGVEVPPFWERG